jgi:hypothetical protein
VERPQGQVQRPSPAPVNRPNNVFGDREGNVYRQDNRGNWDRNTAQGWQPQPPARDTRPAPSTPQPRTRSRFPVRYLRLGCSHRS